MHQLDRSEVAVHAVGIVGVDLGSEREGPRETDSVLAHGLQRRAEVGIGRHDDVRIEAPGEREARPA